MLEIPKNRILSEKKVIKKPFASISRKYINELNQICYLDSNYEYNYALYLDEMHRQGKIAGWIRNTTRFDFTAPIEWGFGKKTKAYIPDFIIFGTDGTYEVHEVKGWMNNKAVAVQEQFKKDYGWLKYKLIVKDDMLSLQAQYGNKLWGWVAIR